MSKQLTLEQLQALVKGNKKLKPVFVGGGYKSNVQGWRKIGNKRYFFKSLWEINFAHYLQHLKDRGEIYDWKYEPKPFKFPKNKYKSKPYVYWPDFQVFPEHNLDWVWFEVKGYMNKISQEKLDRFAQNYPNEDIEVVGKQWFDAALKGLNRVVPGWESLR